MAEYHGHNRRNSQSPEYATWANVKTRCYNKNCESYKRYGAKGIRMCDEWRHSFTAFYRDMGPKPSPKHSIDRIDNSKGYEPGNCRWATREEQARNKASSIWLEIDGISRSSVEWCEIAGTDYHAFFYRYEQGWTQKECVFGKPKRRDITFEGKTKTIREWSAELGVSYNTIAHRLYHHGWGSEQCLYGRKGKPAEVNHG